jgi:hypothetical protein
MAVASVHRVMMLINQYVTLQAQTRRSGKILESEILVSCDSVLQELSTNIFNIIIQ